MSRLDIVIFGATGFTGKKAVEELARLSKKEGISWGIAGRSQKKLDDVLTEAGKNTGEDLSKTKTIIAEVSDSESLKAMCAQARVVANCCGPYRLYGEPVVKACIDTKTDYVDVSGEPQFIESMQMVYGAAARASGVYVVSACGFDSIPNDMGVVFMQQNFGGTVNSIESYLSSHIAPEYSWEAFRRGAINYGTWESLVHGLANWHELPGLRKKLYPEPLPPQKPKLKSRGVLHACPSGFALPFPGADASVVHRSQRFRASKGLRPSQFKAYVNFGSLFSALTTLLAAAVIFVMTKTDFTKRLLLDYPRIFSLGMVTRQGPTEAVMSHTTFTMHLFGRGWDQGTDEKGAPNKEVHVKVRGVNPGYGATVVALMWSAITLLKDRSNLPEPGVLTTGAAFADTNLIKNLNENNLTFQVVKSEIIS